MAQIFGFSGISLTTQRGKQKRILVNTHARTHTHAPKHADTQTFTHASAHPHERAPKQWNEANVHKRVCCDKKNYKNEETFT